MLVELYYRHGEKAVGFFENYPLCKDAARIILYCLVTFL